MSYDNSVLLNGYYDEVFPNEMKYFAQPLFTNGIAFVDGRYFLSDDYNNDLAYKHGMVDGSCGSPPRYKFGHLDNQKYYSMGYRDGEADRYLQQHGDYDIIEL